MLARRENSMRGEIEKGQEWDGKKCVKMWEGVQYKKLL